MRFALLNGVNSRFANMPRRIKVRLANAERNRVLHFRNDVEKVADA